MKAFLAPTISNIEKKMHIPVLYTTNVIDYIHEN